MGRRAGRKQLYARYLYAVDVYERALSVVWVVMVGETVCGVLCRSVVKLGVGQKWRKKILASEPKLQARRVPYILS